MRKRKRICYWQHTCKTAKENIKCKKLALSTVVDLFEYSEKKDTLSFFVTILCIRKKIGENKVKKMS